jgi:hypothetical protein
MLIMSSETKEKDRPSIRSNRPVMRKWKGELSVEVYALLQQYQAFHLKVEKSKPTETEVVDGGLRVAFQKDEAFQKFLGNSGAKPAVLSEQPSS